LSSFVESLNNSSRFAKGDMSSPTPLQLRVREIVWLPIIGAALPTMTVFGKVPPPYPIWSNENRRGYRVTPIIIFGKAQKTVTGPSGK
jgi:hypothetical protein